ncbi:unnamed protein product, partial [Prorocentrum cordatum]
AEEFVQRFFEAQQDFNLVSCELLLPPGSVGFVVEMNGAGLAWLMDAFPVFIAVSSQAARGGRAVTIAIGGPRAYVPSAVREAVAWLLAGPRVAAAPASSAFPRRLGGGLPESPVDLASTQEYGSPPDVVSGLAAERAEEAADGLSPTQPALSRSTELCVEHLAVAAGDATAVAGSRRARQSLGARRVVGALEKDEPFVVIRSFGRAGVLESMALSFFEKAAVPVFLALCPEDPSFHEYMEVCGAQGEDVYGKCVSRVLLVPSGTARATRSLLAIAREAGREGVFVCDDNVKGFFVHTSGAKRDPEAAPAKTYLTPAQVRQWLRGIPQDVRDSGSVAASCHTIQMGPGKYRQAVFQRAHDSRRVRSRDLPSVLEAHVSQGCLYGAFSYLAVGLGPGCLPADCAGANPRCDSELTVRLWMLGHSWLRYRISADKVSCAGGQLALFKGSEAKRVANEKRNERRILKWALKDARE